MKRRTTAPRREVMGGLAKGLDVIRAFTRESPVAHVERDRSARALPAATARRCLLTLGELGYVMQSGRNFLLRPKVLELGAAYLESMNIETLTQTYLEELARQTGDSAALTVLDGNGNRLRGAHVGAHADAPGSARRQPLPRVSDLDGPRAARRTQRRSGCRHYFATREVRQR